MNRLQTAMVVIAFLIAIGSLMAYFRSRTVAYLAPVFIIAVQWVFGGLVLSRLLHAPIDRYWSVYRIVAVIDLVLTISVYGVSAWLLVRTESMSAMSRAVMFTVVVFQLAFEVLFRGLAAALQMGGPDTGLADALGLGHTGYAVLPLIGFAVGLILGIVSVRLP